VHNYTELVGKLDRTFVDSASITDIQLYNNGAKLLTSNYQEYMATGTDRTCRPLCIFKLKVAHHNNCVTQQRVTSEYRRHFQTKRGVSKLLHWGRRTFVAQSTLETATWQR